MQLKDFIKNLNQIIIDKPDASYFEVVTSSDDEGNEFNAIHFEPSVGFFDEEDREFTEGSKANAVCVN